MATNFTPVVDMAIYIPPTAKGTWRQGIGLKSHPKEIKTVAHGRRDHSITEASEVYFGSRSALKMCFCTGRITVFS